MNAKIDRVNRYSAFLCISLISIYTHFVSVLLEHPYHFRYRRTTEFLFLHCASETLSRWIDSLKLAPKPFWIRWLVPSFASYRNADPAFYRIQRLAAQEQSRAIQLYPSVRQDVQNAGNYSVWCLFLRPRTRTDALYALHTHVHLGSRYAGVNLVRGNPPTSRLQSACSRLVVSSQAVSQPADQWLLKVTKVAISFGH